MTDAVVVALITAAATVLGVIISNRAQQAAIVAEINQKLAVHETATRLQIEELQREVKVHNDFARRMPVLEEKISVANHRIDDLERAQRLN